jgi:hypothetical protein
MLPEETSPSFVPSVCKGDVGRNRWLALFIVASFFMFILGFVLRVGIGATPYDTTDSAGHPMGFNDPLSAEHYLLILQHFRPVELLKAEHAYEWLLLSMQAVGAWLLLASPRFSVRVTRWFFAAQLVIFPLGLLLCYAPPCFLLGLVIDGFDREGLTDYPFVFSMGAFAHSTWVISSLIIVVAMRGPGFGVARVWHALVEATRVGGRTFVNALR